MMFAFILYPLWPCRAEMFQLHLHSPKCLLVSSFLAGNCPAGTWLSYVHVGDAERASHLLWEVQGHNSDSAGSLWAYCVLETLMEGVCSVQQPDVSHLARAVPT